MKLGTNWILAVLLLLLSGSSIAQTREIKSSDVAIYSYPFEISGGRISGPGADTLLKRIAESQFFMLGEEHSSPQLSALTNVLLPYFADLGYGNFALEIGGFTAARLKREIEGNRSLRPFTGEFFKRYNDIPVPFFDGTADQTFLKTALRAKFSLWGVDQEFINSPLFLIDEIQVLEKDPRATRGAYLKAREFLAHQLGQMNGEKPSLYLQMFSTGNDFSSYIRLCSLPGQQEIIRALRSSIEIYRMDSLGKGNLPRMELMKRNFAEHYRRTAKGEGLPKVLVKMGSMHLGRGKSWLGVYDLGNMIYELAAFNGTKAVSINAFSRYSTGQDGTVVDYSQRDGKMLEAVLGLSAMKGWLLVDCQKIIGGAKAGRLQVNSELNFLLSRYDYLVLAPLKTLVEKNY